MKALKLLLMLLLLLLLTNTAFALSCAQTHPKVGVISDSSPNNFYYKIILDNAQSYETSNILKNNFYSIDEYKNIVEQYVSGEKLLEQPKDTWRFNSTSIPANVFEKINVDRGDILIQGPPFRVCDYSFLGIFSSDARLKYVIINDAFSDYSYKEAEIKVSPGNELYCKNDYCKVEVDYKVANEKFTLSLNQSYSPKLSDIDSVTLLDSSNYKQRDDDIFLMDWGMGQYLTYFITFSESTNKIKCINIKRPDEKTGCKYTPVYDNNDECIIDYEEKCEVEHSRNIFESFIDWFKSYFS